MINFHKIKSDVEKLSCPTHGKHPELSVSGNSINVKCCCDNFKQTINSKVKSMVEEQTKEYIKKTLKLR